MSRADILFCLNVSLGVLIVLGVSCVCMSIYHSIRSAHYSRLAEIYAREARYWRLLREYLQDKC